MPISRRTKKFMRFWTITYYTRRTTIGWPGFEGRVRFHFTPTSASWLNQIEIVFSLLQRKTLRGASFKSKQECPMPSPPSFATTTNAPNHSAGASGKSKVASSEIP
jgi:hypothetical protein